ncbi:MAG: methyltransferase [Patescibacteria group bacterium]
MKIKKLRDCIDRYLWSGDLFFDFSAIYDMDRHFSPVEKARRKSVAGEFSEEFNRWSRKDKIRAFSAKLADRNIARKLKAFGKLGALLDVVDFTGTIDYRIPRGLRISHQVLRLDFETKQIFAKMSRVNSFEDEYQSLARKFGLPIVRISSLPLDDKRQVIFGEGVVAAVPLNRAKTFRLDQLGGHAALADHLNKGGRNLENYLVSDGAVYAIDNEFLHNKPTVFRVDLQKKYHELSALDGLSGDLPELLDRIFPFVAGYLAVARRLRMSSAKLDSALKFFLGQYPASSGLTPADRQKILAVLKIQDLPRQISVLSNCIGSSSAELRKAFRQCEWITVKLFGFRPIRSISNNFDSKTLVLRDAVTKCVKGRTTVLEIGPGCNATLSQFIQKRWPAVRVDSVEINTDFIRNARRSIKMNGLKIAVRHGDVVGGLRKRYDLIFWNIPAVSSNRETLKKVAGNLFVPVEKFATETDDGTGLIRRFLNEAPKRLTAGGTLLFASNTVYVPERVIKRCIDDSGLRLVRVFSQQGNSSRAYLLKR